MALTSEVGEFAVHSCGSDFKYPVSRIGAIAMIDPLH